MFSEVYMKMFLFFFFFVVYLFYMMEKFDFVNLCMNIRKDLVNCVLFSVVFNVDVYLF